jgi:predicted Zn-dependent peptidase
MPHVQSASVGVFLRVGSRDETPASNGISHVLEHMAFKGTATRSVQAINLDAERLGADVNAYTSKDTTGYFMTGLGRHAEQFLRMTADIVLNSTFPEDRTAARAGGDPAGGDRVRRGPAGELQRPAGPRRSGASTRWACR